MAKLIFGCGYLGSRVARRWLDAAEQVFAVTRSQERSVSLAEQGITPVVADVTRPETLANLPPAETVLFAVGFDRAAGLSKRQVYVDGLRNVLDALPADTQRVIQISSTGVYGQSDGQWIDEQSPCQPDREGGQIVLQADQMSRQHPLGRRSVILRLAGIYGPDRLPRLKQVLAGQPVPAAPDGFLNLIHAEDAAQAVIAAETNAQGGELFLVSDGRPTTRREFYQALAEIADAPPPRFVDPAAGSSAAARAAASKRVCNRKMMERLHVDLKFPTYREGLADAVADLA